MGKKAIHQVTTMLTTSKNIAGARVINKVPGYQYQWIAGGYDLETEYF